MEWWCTVVRQGRAADIVVSYSFKNFFCKLLSAKEALNFAENCICVLELYEQ